MKFCLHSENNLLQMAFIELLAAAEERFNWLPGELHIIDSAYSGIDYALTELMRPLPEDHRLLLLTDETRASFFTHFSCCQLDIRLPVELLEQRIKAYCQQSWFKKRHNVRFTLTLTESEMVLLQALAKSKDVSTIETDLMLTRKVMYNRLLKLRRKLCVPSIPLLQHVAGTFICALSQDRQGGI